jgi:hypothetical protein
MFQLWYERTLVGNVLLHVVKAREAIEEADLARVVTKVLEAE